VSDLSERNASEDAVEVELSRLRAATDREPDLSPMLGELHARISQGDTALEGVRALPSGWRLSIAALSALAIVLLVLLLMPQPELADYPRARLLPVMGALGVLLWPTLRAALRPLHLPALGGGRAWLLWLVAAAATFGLALLPAPEALLTDAAAAAGHDSLRHALPCLLFGLVTGAPVFAAIAVLDRGNRFAPLLAAAAVGLVGNLSLQIHCALINRAHLLWGHAGVSVVALLGGLLLWLALRRRH